MRRRDLAQALYAAAWPGGQIEDSLPEVRDTFYRLADTAAAALNQTLEPAP